MQHVLGLGLGVLSALLLCSLGAISRPSRVSRLRAQSPGASSVQGPSCPKSGRHLKIDESARWVRVRRSILHLAGTMLQPELSP